MGEHTSQTRQIVNWRVEAIRTEIYQLQCELSMGKYSESQLEQVLESLKQLNKKIESCT